MPVNSPIISNAQPMYGINLLSAVSRTNVSVAQLGICKGDG